MPLTTASLHILQPPADPIPALLDSYRALGFTPSRNDSIATREAVLAHGSLFLSIYDSACAQTDDGTLRTLAASISAAWRTCALVTTVQDSQDFEFILFHLGRQVDSAVSDPEHLNAVRGPTQAEIWRNALGAARFARLPHRASDDENDPIARFIAVADAARRGAGAAAEDRLGAWCRLAHLPARAALRGFIDAAASPGNRRLALAPRTVAAPRRPPLAPHRCDDDYPYHRFFPAAWPTEAGADASFVWPVLCRDRGLKNPRVALHIDQTGQFEQGGGFVPRHVGLAAHTSQNGRIVSATPLASFGHAVPLAAARREADLAFDAACFSVPEPRAGKGSEILLLLRIDLRVPAAGEAMMTPTLREAGTEAPPLVLPPLRIVAKGRGQGSGWMPIVADPLDETPVRRQAVLRLNAPAVLTHVAILPDTGQDLRHALRGVIEAWLLPMTDTGLVASIRTHKHPVRDAPGAVRTDTVPVASLLQGQLWPKLFDKARDVQSLQIEISDPGAPHGLAGFSVQTSLRDASAGTAHGFREGAAVESGTIAVALWAIANEAALRLLRLDIVAARGAFAAWVRAASPLQAWMADCTWIPAFDHYESYAMTLYEAAAAVDWIDRGLAGTLCDHSWLRRRLRFVAPHMWLGWELAGLVDTSRLTPIANVTAYADGVEIELRRPRDLPRLERMLVPVLPLHE